jgi:ABC-type transport system involved in multi-copper enzyme maturation permease subunit
MKFEKKFNDFALIFWEEIKESFRTRKVILIALLSVIVLLVSYGSVLTQVIALMFFKAEPTMSWPILVTYYLLFALIPLFVIFLGHDSISSEFENNEIRGILTKINRDSFILGKFFAISAIVFCLSLILLFISSFFAFFKLDTSLDLFHPLVLSLYLLFYVMVSSSITVFFSMVSGKGSRALIASFTLLCAILYLTNYAGLISCRLLHILAIS